MRIFSRPGVTVLALFVFATTAVAQDGSIAGQYSVKGMTNDHGNYTGTASIVLKVGTLYNATWTLAQKVTVGACILVGSGLSCVSCKKAYHATVTQYNVTPAGLDGLRYTLGDARTGTEMLAPRPDVNRRNLAGPYTMTGRGSDVYSSPFAGTATLTQRAELGAITYEIDWKSGGTATHGVAVRSPEPDALTAAQCDRADDASAIHYVVGANGKQLVGAWTASLGAQLTSGIETLTRR